MNYCGHRIHEERKQWKLASLPSVDNLTLCGPFESLLDQIVVGGSVHMLVTSINGDFFYLTHRDQIRVVFVGEGRISSETQPLLRTRTYSLTESTDRNQNQTP